MFIIKELFIVGKILNQPKCPPIYDLIKKCGVYTQGNAIQPLKRIDSQQSHYWVYIQRTINRSTIRTHAHECSLWHCLQ